MTKYATKAAFARAVELAKSHGIEIGGFDLFPDGRIRIMTPKSAESTEPPASLFDQLEREGRI